MLMESFVQKGTECLTLIVRKGCDELLAWTDQTGRSGLIIVLSFIGRLLSPSDDSESTGLLVGDLIVHLFRNCGPSILPSLPELLHLMITRITTAKTGTFLQVSPWSWDKMPTTSHASLKSLIIPFAYLIQSQRDTVVSLLESISILHEDSRNGLEVLLRAWCDNAEMVQGFWPSRVRYVHFPL